MLDLSTIRNMDADELMSAAVDMYDLMAVDQAAARIKIKLRAKELGVGEDFDEYLKALDEAAGITAAKNVSAVSATNAAGDADQAASADASGSWRGEAVELILRRAPDGKVIQSIENFYDAMVNDPYYATMRRNLMTGCVEIEQDGVIVKWNEGVNSRSKGHLSYAYGLRRDQYHTDAFNILSSERAYNPVTEMLEGLEWDGVERMDTILIKWLKCEDTPYTREVSRLIFAGGIHRAFDPGCKFDEVPILIGEKQGEGKSSFIRWLAMDDAYFHDITDVEGQKGIEAIQGAWICEISELLALKRAKDVEAIKAYLTRQVDHYRMPYERFSDDYPRRCIFIGTTNSVEFLSDRTGNRRFYPVKVYSSGFELHEHQDEIKADIVQCWAEALARFRAGKLKPHANFALMQDIKQAQEAAVEEDARIGLIERYLKTKRDGDYVCTLELWADALGNDYEQRKPDVKRELNPLLQLMSCFADEWIRLPGRKYIPKYGQQRVWQCRRRKMTELRDDDDKLPFED